MTDLRTARADKAFAKHQSHKAGSEYQTAGEAMSVEDKLAILRERGQADLIEIFKDWKPRTAPTRRKGAPLDQRVSITISVADRVALDGEVKAIKASGEKTTIGALIRNRALGNVDLKGWSEIADRALRELNEIDGSKKELTQRRLFLEGAINAEDDEEQNGLYDLEIVRINQKLDKLVARSEKRSNRLQGRMSMPESETVKWRAQKLCISTSDYLRMMIFGLEPYSNADSHMSLDAKRRFYVSIIEVADKGFGTPPNIFQCSQCETYMEEITRLKAQVQRLQRLS